MRKGFKKLFQIREIHPIRLQTVINGSMFSLTQTRLKSFKYEVSVKKTKDSLYDEDDPLEKRLSCLKNFQQRLPLIMVHKKKCKVNKCVKKHRRTAKSAIIFMRFSEHLNSEYVNNGFSDHLKPNICTIFLLILLFSGHFLGILVVA